MKFKECEDLHETNEKLEEESKIDQQNETMTTSNSSDLDDIEVEYEACKP